MIYVIKKDNTLQEFDVTKIISAIQKSASRVMYDFTQDELDQIQKIVTEDVSNKRNHEKRSNKSHIYITVPTMHNIVEHALEMVSPAVAKSYRDYRNYKTSFVHILDDVYKASQSIMYIGDKENSNSDSTLASTKRCLIYGELNKELYKKFFLTTKMLQACKDGYIYIHDMTSRRDGFNCTIFDVETVLTGGFEMGNIWYNEPKSLDTAFDVIGDIVLSAASQQYGGFTISRIDEILAKYAKKSFDRYRDEIYHMKVDAITKYTGVSINSATLTLLWKESEDEAMKKVREDMRQGFQGIEYKLNTVASSRGDYPFTTVCFGASTDQFAVMASEVALEVRQTGQGAPGKKRSVLFPKLVFTYTEDLHGGGKPLEDLFNKAIKCSSMSMYPKVIGAYYGDVVRKPCELRHLRCRLISANRGGKEFDFFDNPVLSCVSLFRKEYNHELCKICSRQSEKVWI